MACPFSVQVIEETCSRVANALGYPSLKDEQKTADELYFGQRCLRCFPQDLEGVFATPVCHVYSTVYLKLQILLLWL